MSWKTSGKLLLGPPTTSNANKLDSRFRPNLGGRNAFQREQHLARHYGDSNDPVPQGRTEWDVLKENHRFIRDDEEPENVSWEERLARAYESKLFKEFALIDLKHFKARRLALRWRTAPEVVNGLGEDTCGSLRCKYHQSPSHIDTPARDISQGSSAGTPGPSVSQRGTPRPNVPSDIDFGLDNTPLSKRVKRVKRMAPLRAFELPFVYEEAGERKEALVKVKLCPKCQAKLTWKPGKDEPKSEEEEEQAPRRSRLEDDSRDASRSDRRSRREYREDDSRNDHREKRKKEDRLDDGRSKTRDRSRSRSPRRVQSRRLI